MPHLLARDGTRLAYRVVGQGLPVMCLPGGPMLDSAYLGDLGGLSGSVRLILVDPRGTGESQTPDDLSSCRCDKLVDDVEALREHLGLERMGLLAHSGGANLAASYTARHPERVGELLLVTPSTIAVGITATSDDRREIVRRRQDEPWYGQVATAFESIAAGNATEDDWDAIAPFTYGRWDAAAQAHYADMEQRRKPDVAAAFGAEGAFDPEATRAALATFRAPVLLLAGELDLAGPAQVLADYAELFPAATFITQSGAGHFPWLDDPARFTRTITSFLM
ncbi:pimeloyl-ACP methyl ester carboxylesterase [Saccharothrix tamanrassetensis]|uniref:Pimeloyl-ACP methyl ester carboxylesterase n=1 Tax=Saccharothrix tamanrassetensis TaxID=1051531 RepID=A0A841C974_9PSEU|nr:alpha/beta hydrolase [Saccharothrix tamanrassetensis]MBB5953691.1 pimeloyl-ACP methyl ester carboxylesterase [Saccharothrix tamanrassetensis]